MIKNIDKIEQLLKLEAGTLKAAIESEDEQEITLEGLNVYTQDELSSLEENIKKQEYRNGKVAGEEMAVKAVRDEYGLDFEGKTVRNFAEAFKNKIESESKKQPTEKIKELETDLQKLREKNGEWENKFNQLNDSISNERKEYKLKSLIESSVPKDTILPADKISLLFRNDYKVDFNEDGNPVVMKGDEVIKDEKTRNPLGVKDVLGSWLTENNFLKQEQQGRGEKDQRQNTKFGTIEAFNQEMEEKGMNPNSEEYQKEYFRRIKEGELKV